MDYVVARIGRPHGIRGEVTVELRTDDPARRLAPGSTLRTDPAGAGPLTVTSLRDHQGTLLVGFAGHEDRSGAESLRNVLLLVGADEAEDEAEEDAWYPHQLAGLSAVDTAGRSLGTVRDLLTGSAQDLLVVRPGGGGDDVLVPFVRALVPEVDVAGGRVVLDPPGGLFPDPDPDGQPAAGEDA
ncbi:16S rRNA processing protein RimM [Kineococcus xinjiangensis]|uniref:Ribosome maturation factor RimM n=1 Tax=Kineococcus xinjiangensis TaxID=512762 RepID=A0A2S6IW06_9ACTN|nr:ribosome maturation factor RimM [Kineococcus xinjiangensis]PPK98528.1 16S rRNA processing protein RimM [Kineococcus xinjiangensis]